MEKLIEHTNGSHIYMKMRLDNGKIEEIGVYLRNDSAHYITSADHTQKTPEEREAARNEIIQAFNELY